MHQHAKACVRIKAASCRGRNIHQLLVIELMVQIQWKRTYAVIDQDSCIRASHSTAICNLASRDDRIRRAGLDLYDVFELNIYRYI